MNILLISLPGTYMNEGCLYPVGIGYLASALKSAHDVQSLNYDNIRRAKRDFASDLSRIRPDIVGFTCNTFNRGFVRDAIRQVKEFDPKIRVVVGGIHATFCYEQVLKDYKADVVVIGEGENTILDLCSAIEQKTPLETVNGIAFHGDHGIACTSPRTPIMNLDELPVPDYSYARPLIDNSGMGCLITSRGCPVRCTFCSTSSFWGQKVRMNSPKRVVDEMEMLVSRFNVRKIFFYDDTFNLGISRVMEICKEIKLRDLKVEWGCDCRVVPVSEEMIAEMVESGCRHICWGIETGSERLLKTIHKNISLKQIRNAYEFSRKFSHVMSTGAFSMVGNPGETEETIDETVRFFNTLPITDAPSTSILYVLPGTVLYNDLKKSGQINETVWTECDSIPLFTIENSFLTLLKWSKRVRASGNRLPFDTTRHFWNIEPKTVGVNNKILEKFTSAWKLAFRLLKVSVRARDYLSSGRLLLP